jgi:hypothetical protein
MATAEMTAHERAASAVRELARKGEPMTQERVMTYLTQRDGRGCSERDAWQALSEYRKSRDPEVGKAVRDIRAAIRRRMRALDADTRLRVARELAQVGRGAPEWMAWMTLSSRRRA